MERTAWLQVRVSPAELAALKAAAAAEDSDVSEFVRQALGQWLWRIGPVTVDVSAATDDGADEDETTNLRRKLELATDELAAMDEVVRQLQERVTA